ncbi:22545_t:CDS:2 [Gigaspora rosea]|nr:22545_t:CDS:2 [Gigaspora rosea]
MEDKNFLEKSPSKEIRYIEKQDEDGRFDNILEEMVRPETPMSKEKEYIAEYMDIDIEIIRLEKIKHEMEEILEQQLQSNRKRDSNVLVFYTG